MFLKVSPSRQDGKISRPVRLAKTTKLVSPLNWCRILM
ncbi:unnamed protein product [Brassica rapa subsp. trilocularis]|uniref:(rape) hypothetical protein n=1 Tax=Brassica napus TaxID=3708 RepID=A0A078IQX9_BRANA|nr:unnamed protein product [Brassica napus]CDY52357.1 BnaA08g30920D [Brassica napus]